MPTGVQDFIRIQSLTLRFIMYKAFTVFNFEGMVLLCTDFDANFHQDTKPAQLLETSPIFNLQEIEQENELCEWTLGYHFSVALLAIVCVCVVCVCVFVSVCTQTV